MGLFGGGGTEKATLKLFAANGPRDAQAQLSKGGDINGYVVPRVGRMMPLQRQAYLGNAAMVSWLLENGADPALADGQGDTPLHTAANRGNVDVIRILLAGKAAIESKDRRGNTPLHRSVMPGDLAAARVLLEHGADSNARSEEGTPLSIAQQGFHSNKHEMAQLLRDHNATRY